MDQMKTKRFALLLACIICSTVLFLLFGDPQPTINNLVAETHSRISHWKNLQVNEEILKVPDPEAKYLKALGFTVKDPRLFPKDVWTNVSLPVFVTVISSKDNNFFTGFYKSFQHFFPDSLLLVYDLGLIPAESLSVNGICNSSNCALRTFDFDAYPSHVRNLELFAYRPIIIQETLNQAGAVIWMDIRYIFTSGDIQSILKQAETVGIVSWTINPPTSPPTSALTHPRMFDYFTTNQEKFIFHRMVDPDHILLYNTHAIHFQLMLPWIKCALVHNCIAPIGAQNSGCRFDKKPLYRYSGCHRYDMSALNVALGLMFDYTASRYSAKEENKFFTFADMEKQLDMDLEKNVTTLADFT